MRKISKRRVGESYLLDITIELDADRVELLDRERTELLDPVVPCLLELEMADEATPEEENSVVETGPVDERTTFEVVVSSPEDDDDVGVTL